MEKEFSPESCIAPKQPVVRFATHADLPQIAHVARVTWDAAYSQIVAEENRREFLKRAYKPENLAAAINVPDHWFYVAELEQEIIGFGHFLRRYHPNRPRAELVRLYILPAYQNWGIGSTILKTGLVALAETEIEQCFVSVQAGNTPAQRFYERHGFSYQRSHGQFLGTQIVTLVEYVRPISELEVSQ